MSATPEASDEYSRGNRASREPSGGESGPAWRATRRRSLALGRGSGALIVAGVAAGSLLLIAAEFATLYQVHLATKLTPISSVTVGSHNSYAMIPLAVLATALAVAAWRGGGRAALLAVCILGVVALLITLLGDLPDASASGLAEHNSVAATTTPKAGLYLETGGAILLIATGGIAFLLVGLPGRPRPARR